jgi:hypothetical protein
MADAIWYRRANGGVFWHILVGENDTALCGYCPSSPTTSRMHPRGRWDTLPQQTPGSRTCPRCVLIHGRQQGRGA